MKTVFFVNKDNYSQAKNKVYADDLVSKQSIIIRDSSALELKKAGYYLQIEGEDAAVKKAREMLAGTAEELRGEQAKEVMAAIEKQESSAAEGFGAIFG